MRGDHRSEKAPELRGATRPRLPVAGALALTALPVTLLGAAPAAWPARLAAEVTRVYDAARPGAPPDVPPARPANGSSVVRAGRLVLHDSAFHGVVTVRTPSGPERALKFTARFLDLGDLRLTTGSGADIHLETGPATTSTVRGDGTVTLYITRLTGTLTSLGGAPLPADRSVTLTPDALPPWVRPAAARPRTIAFRNVRVSQMGQFGGSLAVRGAVFRVG
ncbi:hypothetical protein [Streptomyces sp. NPDC058964]|uniref:hypothetical protein n=1 Tax=Streptomyces sp. NPDC058964 TaxID=3346681 RepID=UPI00368EAAAB